MKNLPIDWDKRARCDEYDRFISFAISVNQLRYTLLKSGKVPCEWTGKKTGAIKSKIVGWVSIPFEERAVYPELYSAPRGWYGGHYVWRSSLANCPKMSSVKCMTMPNCSANIGCRPCRMLLSPLTGYVKPQSIIGATVGALNPSRAKDNSSFTYRKSSSSTFSAPRPFVPSPAKPVAYPNAERFSKEDEPEEVKVTAFCIFSRGGCLSISHLRHPTNRIYDIIHLNPYPLPYYSIRISKSPS